MDKPNDETETFAVLAQKPIPQAHVQIW